MTRFKKLMALTLATTMVFTTNVFAETGKTISDSSVSGNGQTAYVDTNIFDVDLPTSTALGFKLDPQGLVSLEDGDQATLSALSAYGGRIVGDSTAAVINNSPKKILVTVSMAAATTSANDVTFVTASANKADVSANKLNNALVYVVPSKGTISSANAYTSVGKGIILQNNILKTDALTGGNTDEFKFVLDAPEYSVSNDGVSYNLIQTGVSNGFGLQIGGIINPNADWLDFTGTPTKSLGVKAIFSITDVADTDVVDTTIGIDNLVSSSSTEIMAAESTDSKSFTWSTGGGDIVIKCATTPTSLTFMRTGQIAVTLATSDYTISGTTLTIPAATLNTVATSTYTPLGKGVYTVTIGGVSDTYTITIN
ncbi:MAG: hypothetical protein PHY47_07485 [Lachnospiraceae bacterium]|nr:hypothetical protein [Lachnospiraceae bacterium]